MNARLDIDRSQWDDTPTPGQKLIERINLGGVHVDVTFEYDDDCEDGVDILSISFTPGIKWDYEYYLSAAAVSEIRMELWRKGLV